MRGHHDIIVAVLDGPVNIDHPCLHNASLKVFNQSTVASSRAGAASRHGAAVASILFGQPGSALEGIVPGCSGVVIPIFQDAEDGGFVACTQIELAGAMLKALHAGANVINISGGEFALGPADPALVSAVTACEDAGVLVVAAAGNEGCDCAHFPAAFPTVLAVGALAADGGPLPSSNWGAAYDNHAVMTLGENLPTAKLDGGVELRSGTSMACAVVSGAAAWLLSEMATAGLSPDPLWVRRVLLGSVEKIADGAPDNGRALSGRLNLTAALDRLASLSRPQIAHANKEEPMSGAVAETETTMAEAVTAPPMVVAPSAAPVASAVRPSAIEPSAGDPSCPTGNCGSSGGGLVYALGQIGVDFLSESRRQSLGQEIGFDVLTPGREADLLKKLEERPSLAQSFIWTLLLDGQPIYALVPMGAFAAETFATIREFFGEQLTKGVERVSIPGTTFGNMTLASGHAVPIVVPEQRGMYSWNTEALIRQAMETAGAENAEQKRLIHESIQQRIYYENRNLGASSRDRAFNFAATRAHQYDEVIEQAVSANMRLGGITVEKSPLGRPGSDNWDVKLTFFAPKQRQDVANLVARATVDVSDVIPVQVGPVRHWFDN